MMVCDARLRCLLRDGETPLLVTSGRVHAPADRSIGIWIGTATAQVLSKYLSHLLIEVEMTP